jgi:transcription elongation factor Elf1
MESVEVFNCLACLRESRVCEVKHEGGGAYLVCEHCGAENAFKRVPAPSGSGWEIEMTGLRDKDKPAP